jgi:hypothetical protein
VTTAAAKPAPATTARPRTLTDRYLAAFPLATTYLWLLVLYGWQAERHPTPWVFYDEIKFTRIARGIADHLHPVVMGDSASLGSLATLLMAPAWAFGSVGESYAVAKWIGVACMTATLFPAYLLARMVVGRWFALLAGVGATVVPALGYSVFLVEEPYAYPFATLCLYLIAKALVTRDRRWVIAAIVASLAAPLLRNQLLVLPAVFGVTWFALAWREPRLRRMRAGWTTWDWVGLSVLLIGASVLVNALLGYHDKAWFDATATHKQWIFLYGTDALGTLAMGVGIFPLVATALALAPGRGRTWRPEERVFGVLTAVSVLFFVYYAGIKGAYLREQFSNIVVERNVIYLAPLFFVGLAMFLERPRFHGWVLAAAGIAGLYLVLHTPLLLASRGYYDAPGVEALQGLNRWFAVPDRGARAVLVAMLLVSLEVVVLVRSARPRIAQLAIGAAAVLAIGWSLTGEVVFAGASVAHSKAITANMGTPRSWIGGFTHGKPVVFLGTNLNPLTTSAPSATLYEAEFWNPEIVRQWSLDGSAPPPTLTPNIDGRGHLLDSNYKEVAPNIDYYATTPDVDLDGEQLAGPDAEFAPANGYKLWKVNHPVRLAHTTRGLTGDGWASSPDGKLPATVSYSQYATPGYKDGYLSVHFTRSAACLAKLPTETATIRVGRLAVDKDNNPVIGKLLKTVRVPLPACTDETKTIITPFKAPFQAEVSISPTFQLHHYDPRSGEMRWLSSQVAFSFDGLNPTS